MAGKERKKAQSPIFRDVERLSQLRDKLWAVQVSRIEEKTPQRGSYTAVPIDDLVISLNRNVGQFTVALCNRKLNEDTCDEAHAEQTKKTIQQAGDIVNLVSMVLDRLHLTAEDYDMAK